MNSFLKSLRSRLETRRQRQAAAAAPHQTVTPQQHFAPMLTGTGRDYAVMAENDRALKLHLPEAAWVALDELRKKHGSSFSTLVRHVLFLFLYGRYDLIALLERGETQFDLIEHGCSGRYMRVPAADNRTADLGKNDHSIKTWIPSQMHADLSDAATKRGVPVSVFVREIVVSYLFGHVALPERQPVRAG